MGIKAQLYALVGHSGLNEQPGGDVKHLVKIHQLWHGRVNSAGSATLDGCSVFGGG